jgi:hypothetical protein
MATARTANLSELVGQTLSQLPWTQKGGIKKKYGFLSSNFIILCMNIHRSVWQILGLTKFKMAVVPMVTKMQFFICQCCSYQLSSISVRRVTCYDNFSVFQFFNFLAF